MAKATPEQTRKATKAAIAVSFIVTLFAVLFVGSILSLDSMAHQRDETEVVIAEEAPNEPFYVLLIGSDTRKGTALYTGRPTEHAQLDQHSDVMTLMRVDPNTYTVSLLTIPRDTVLSDESEKLNCALLGDDPQQVVEAVKELTGLRADYYMLITFGTFAKLIDALGGVVMDVPADVEVSDPTTGGTIKLKAGDGQLLNGAQALALARARVEYETDQDAVRQVNVRSLEQAIIERVLNDRSIGVEALLVALNGDTDTNLDLPMLGYTVLDFMNNADRVTIYAGTGPYTGGVRANDGQWVVPNDHDTWKKIIKKFKAGKDFSNIVEPPTYTASADDSQESSAASAQASAASASATASSAAASSSEASANAAASSASSTTSNSAEAPSSASSTSEKK